MRGRTPTAILGPGLTLLLLVLLLGHLLADNAAMSVWDEDEAAYAGFARRMVVAGDWLVPDFPYSKAHRKFPGFFWCVAGSYAALGIHEFALRLPGVLATLLTMACVWRGGRFLLGAETARLGALVLGTTLLISNIAKLALTDSVLMLFQTIAALALLRAAVRPALVMTVMLWAAVAAGVLVKGPPILITVAGMFLFLLVFYRRRWNLVHLHPWFGLPLALVPAAVWLWLVWQQNEMYVLFLAYHQVLHRVGGSFFGQAGVPGTYFVLMFVCLLPWTAYFLPALGDTWRNLRRRRTAFVLLAAWLFGGWLVWELPASKLPTYVMGAYPALALLIARQVQRAADGRLAWSTHATLRASFRALIVASVLSAVALGAAGIWMGALWAKLLVVLPVAASVGTASVAARWQRLARPRAAARVLLYGSVLTNLLLWGVVVRGIEPVRAVTRHVAEAIAAHCTPETEVVIATSERPPSLAFYLAQHGRTFRDILAKEPEPAKVAVNWSLLWQGRLGELVKQVQSQRPPPLSEEEEPRQVLARARELLASEGPLVLVLDAAQREALVDTLGDVQIERIRGFRSDRGRFVEYAVVIRRAALRESR